MTRWLLLLCGLAAAATAGEPAQVPEAVLASPEAVRILEGLTEAFDYFGGTTGR